MDLLNKKNYPFFRRAQGIFLLLGLMLLTAIVGCIFGSTAMSFSDFIGGLLMRPGYDKQSIIIYYIRIPRILGALLAGIGLSISGVLLQTITGNPLAGPNIIGINAGAGLACVLILSFFPMLTEALPFASAIGALATTALILFIARRINTNSGTLVLSGIACTTLLNAGISTLTLINPDVLMSYNAFSVGGLNGVVLSQLYIPAAMIGICLIVILLFSKQIQCLFLGDTIARSLGVNVSAVRFLCAVCASVCAASVVSYAGLLGFVGLVVPHIARRLCGCSVGPQLIVSSIIGSILVMIADLLGRIILAPTEISVGIIMAFIGTPFFFILLLQRRKVYD